MHFLFFHGACSAVWAIIVLFLPCTIFLTVGEEGLRPDGWEMSSDFATPLNFSTDDFWESPEGERSVCEGGELGLGSGGFTSSLFLNHNSLRWDMHNRHSLLQELHDMWRKNNISYKLQPIFCSNHIFKKSWV